MTRGLTKDDLSDLDFVDAPELASDGLSSFLSSVTVVSTTSSTKRVVVSGVYLIHDPDQRIEPADIVVLTGTAPGGIADGTYTVASIVNDTTFVVVEAIADSTGGSVAFRWPPGSSKVGLNPTGMVNVTAHNLQAAVKNIDDALINDSQHRALRHLIHFVETNSPGDGFGAGPYYCETNYTSNVFPTDETWYETSAKLKRICRWEGTYNVNKTFATEKWIVYKSDGVNPAATATDTISYSGVTETSRSRAIAVY